MNRAWRSGGRASVRRIYLSQPMQIPVSILSSFFSMAVSRSMLLGSRRSLAQLRAYPWQGDLDRYLPGIAHMDLPASDLVE